jgi:hypothetical protein
MEFILDAPTFENTCQWHAWRLGLDLAPYVEANPRRDLDVTPGGWLALHQFFKDLYQDLYEHPETYGLPIQPFEPFTENRLRMQEDTEKKKRVMATSLKARKAIESGILDFLYQLGQTGVASGDQLLLDPAFYDQLIAEKAKKGGIKSFGNGFERVGLSFTSGQQMNVSNSQYPGMLAALGAFAKTCAGIKDNGLYFFRRCDLGVLEGKRQPTLDDALRLARPELHEDIRNNDTLLLERKYKREIMVGDANAGYRFRYNKKKDRVVYWVRLMSWSSPPFHHNLRWDFKSDLTGRMFARLDEVRPGLADRIFEGIKRCEYDYENCMARVVLERSGQSVDCCSEVAWDAIGETPGDMEDLRSVLQALDELV